MLKLEYPSVKHEDKNSPLPVKIELLKKSVKEVEKYELLTTNQYLKQMELVLKIFHDLSETLARQCAIACIIN